MPQNATKTVPIEPASGIVRFGRAFTEIGRAKNAFASLPEQAISQAEWDKTKKTAERLEKLAASQYRGLMENNAAQLSGMAAEAYEKLKISYPGRACFFNEPEVLLKIIQMREMQGFCLKKMGRFKESILAFNVAVSKSDEYSQELGYLAGLKGEKPDANKLHDSRTGLVQCLGWLIEALEKTGDFQAIAKAYERLGEVRQAIAGYWEAFGNQAAAGTEKRQAQEAFEKAGAFASKASG
jgi:tetratricopeptide (TPR) repeat protein